MEVTPPSCQEHIKNTSTWATIITENWQKNSHTTKATRKIHSKKGRKAIESRHMPLRGDSEKRGEYTGDSCPREWGVRDKDGAPVLGSYMGEMSPLTGLRTRETKKRAVGSLDSTREECAQAGCPRGRTERSLLQQLSFPIITLVWTPAPAGQKLWPCSLHVTACHWIWSGLNLV